MFWELLLEPLTESDKLPTAEFALEVADDAAELAAIAGNAAATTAKTKADKTEVANFMGDFQKKYYRTSLVVSNEVIRNKLRKMATPVLRESTWAGV